MNILSIKPLKSEAIHETGLSGNVVTSFFPLIIYIYIYIEDGTVEQLQPEARCLVQHLGFKETSKG